MLFNKRENVGQHAITPSVSPITSFTFDHNWNPLNVQPKSILKKPKLSERSSTRYCTKKIHFSRFNEIMFYPVNHLYHLDAWPSSLRLLTLAHMVILLVSSLSLSLGGCLAYTLDLRFIAFIMWLSSCPLTVALIGICTCFFIKNKSGMSLRNTKIQV